MNYLKTVYSLLYPETKEMIEKLWLSNPIYLYEDSFLTPKYQTEIESDFKKEWLNWSKSQVKFNDLLFNFYNTAGSSEAIRESLADLKSNGQSEIYVFDGDYEGYSSLAQAYNVKVISISRDNWKSIIPHSIKSPLYFSNPSSIDGNVWNECQDFLEFMRTNNPECKIRIDLCYLGCSIKELNLNLDNVDMIFFSLSKVFGVYFHRIGGVFSKQELKGLYGNQWFKNLFSLYLGINLLKQYPLCYFPKKYEKNQLDVIDYLNKKENINLIPSDVIILSTALNQDSSFKRGNLSHGRYCLTPILQRKIYGEHL